MTTHDEPGLPEGTVTVEGYVPGGSGVAPFVSWTPAGDVIFYLDGREDLRLTWQQVIDAFHAWIEGAGRPDVNS